MRGLPLDAKSGGGTELLHKSSGTIYHRNVQLEDALPGAPPIQGQYNETLARFYG